MDPDSEIVNGAIRRHREVPIPRSPLTTGDPPPGRQIRGGFDA